MKTTVDISDSLLKAAKEFSTRQGITFRELVEAGLREVLKECRRSEGFRLRRASYRGQGLQPGVPEGVWEVVRAKTYEGRGG
jgi:hypothetical protein